MTSSSDALGASETKDLCQNRQHVCRVEKGRGNENNKKSRLPFRQAVTEVKQPGVVVQAYQPPSSKTFTLSRQMLLACRTTRNNARPTSLCRSPGL